MEKGKITMAYNHQNIIFVTSHTTFDGTQHDDKLIITIIAIVNHSMLYHKALQQLFQLYY